MGTTYSNTGFYPRSEKERLEDHIFQAVMLHAEQPFWRWQYKQKLQRFIDEKQKALDKISKGENS